MSQCGDDPAALRPARVRPVLSDEIELRIFNGTMRELLQPSAPCEVWTITGVYVCTLTGAAVTRMVQNYIAAAALQTAVAREMETATPERIPLAPAPTRQLPIPLAQREALRAKRRRRAR